MTDAPKPLNASGNRRGMHRKGNGSGWGGPAKGEGGDRPMVLFGERPQPDTATRTERVKQGIANRNEILQFYTDVLRDVAEPTPNKIAAADKLLDRIEGKAVARNVNVSADDIDALTDEQLLEIINKGARGELH